MTNEQLELILELHKAGKITTQEAKVLMSPSADKIDPYRVSDWPWATVPTVEFPFMPQQVWYSTSSPQA